MRPAQHNQTLDALRRAVAANHEVAGALGGVHALLDQLGFSLSDPDNYAWAAPALSEWAAAGIAQLDGLATALRAGDELPARPDESALRRAARQSAIKGLLISQGRPLPQPGAPIDFGAADLAAIDLLEARWLAGFWHGRQRISLPARGRGRHRYAS